MSDALSASGLGGNRLRSPISWTIRFLGDSRAQAQRQLEHEGHEKQHGEEQDEGGE